MNARNQLVMVRTYSPPVSARLVHVIIVGKKSPFSGLLPSDAKVVPIEALKVALISVEIGILDVREWTGRQLVDPTRPRIAAPLTR